jgi:hypothetical protein
MKKTRYCDVFRGLEDAPLFASPLLYLASICSSERRRDPIRAHL